MEPGCAEFGANYGETLSTHYYELPEHIIISHNNYTKRFQKRAVVVERGQRFSSWLACHEFEPSIAKDPLWSGDSRRVAIMDFGAPLTIGEVYLKIIMSSFLGFCEGDTRNRWRDGQVCPDVDKELWRLGPDSSGDERRPEEKRRTRKRREKSSKREGLIVGGRGEENPRVLLGDADQESKTRMSKNALRTGPRQAVERAVSKRAYHTGYRHGNY
ncbi:hypothetical protein TNCV_4414051 [Trichonephila clavipes]|uniref:Uncharacterized protein n=1 Tax=Trichonephila clavipes TaxID=2585209 RepID=A0A8X6S7K0_TRICX|nr:hypothetical protein TNCV_4414051 [Trichonephila clavipes]